eukprot:GILK01014320.1.p1 GENE.GILK01014320.1~~GILK01014320.1.p1  ORF type:complete len:178 (-),score=34.50 GILK01014320.1:43-576(-)
MSMRGGGDAGGGKRGGGPVFVRQVPKFLQGLIKPTSAEEELEQDLEKKRMPEFPRDDSDDEADFENAQIVGEVPEDLEDIIKDRLQHKESKRAERKLANAEPDALAIMRENMRPEDEKVLTSAPESIKFKPSAKRKQDTKTQNRTDPAKKHATESKDKQKPKTSLLSFSMDDEEEAS